MTHTQDRFKPNWLIDPLVKVRIMFQDGSIQFLVQFNSVGVNFWLLFRYFSNNFFYWNLLVVNFLESWHPQSDQRLKNFNIAGIAYII